ncbi:alpha/beta hydrolase [Actinomycetospora sp. NBRC 106378]|uniref:alpha/beta fold hydrolase n=1 Tax=Actinomycetospora sp. NBRC 106378 TaxID=3032208 RepID=UPI0024A356F9|nr:alpha/beta hydrolase [Actinomycetospora sp. NBRC 106378]GLZ53478.1 alpha/beta hydrolase [Actinomycetospora sp. NBRC 106378]
MSQPRPTTDHQPSTDAARVAWQDAPTRTLEVSGVRFRYRELGPRGGVPVVFLHHLTAVLDDWDPRVVDGLAAHHHVITFDNRGVGGSSGSVPSTVQEMAADAAMFIRGLGHEKVDLLGFSLGGGVAQFVTLQNPDLVRKAIFTGTGPAGAGGLDKMVRIAGLAYLKAALTFSDPRNFLFFPRTPEGRRAAKAYLTRLKERTADRDERISLQAMGAQLRAIVDAGRQQPQDLGVIDKPVLVANGDADLMVASEHSADIARRIPGAQLVIYPGSGHGGIFQYHEQFVPTALAFLAS